MIAYFHTLGFVFCCITLYSIMFPYSEWSAASGDKKTELQTCTSQCTKLVSWPHPLSYMKCSHYLYSIHVYTCISILNVCVSLSYLSTCTCPCMCTLILSCIYMYLVYQLPCGHRCPRQCHPGSCPSPEKCRRKVTLRCSCRRIKKVK